MVGIRRPCGQARQPEVSAVRGIGGQPGAHGVLVIVVDAHHVVTGPDDQARSDAGSETAGAMDPEFPVRKGIEPHQQLVQREVDRARDGTLGPFVVSTHVQDHPLGLVRIEQIAPPPEFGIGERGLAVVTELVAVGEFLELSGGGAIQRWMPVDPWQRSCRTDRSVPLAPAPRAGRVVGR